MGLFSKMTSTSASASASASPRSNAASMSTPASIASIRTTKDNSPSNGADTTGMSSLDEEDPWSPKYRAGVQPTNEVKAHCQIHLEEDLYPPVILFLDNLLTDGISTKNKPKPPPVRVAPPPQLALLATLAIHPLFTSRPAEATFPHVAARALTYLRGVLSLTGPVNARLNRAFDFRHAGSGRGARDRESGVGSYRYGSPLDNREGSTSSRDSDDLTGSLANEHSIWRQAPDFWATLGWAFRCAASHPHRWRHWKVWIEFLIEVLELDWDERVEQDKQNDDKNRTLLKESLLALYLDDLRQDRKNVEKEVLRALMAFADENDQSDDAFYRPIFDHELSKTTAKNKRKRAETIVDLDKNQFGDYLDSWADDVATSDSEAPTPQKPKPTRAIPKRRGPGRPPKFSPPSPPAPASRALPDGIAETIPLRLRLYRLLSAASEFLPSHLCTTARLYEGFSGRLRALPLATFRLFVQSHATGLPTFAQVSLLRTLADDMLPRGQRPHPADVDSATDAVHGLSWPMLAECFLPYAATRITVEENARVSLVLESMVWFVFAHGKPVGEVDVAGAVERGIRAREDKVARRTRGAAGKEGKDEAAARGELERSVRSLRVFVDVVGSF